MTAVPVELLHAMLASMWRIRAFEERSIELFQAGELPGFLHAQIGQEAVCVGTCSALNDDDYLTSTHRGHGDIIAKGGRLDRMFAELYAKETGYCRGKGGSMHIFDAAKGFLGGHGIVGSHIPLAAGVAFAHKYRGGDQVCLCFFGEAAANIGAFHETLNMAELWDLPVVFVIENNGYGMGTAVARAAAITNFADRGAAYGMASEQVDGQNVLTVREAFDRAVARARKQSKPTLLEIKTYRYVGHSMSDAAHGTYRSKEEVDQYRQKDPIAILEDLMRAAGYWDDARHQALDAEVMAEVADSVTFAEESPDPDPSALFRDVYAEEGHT